MLYDRKRPKAPKVWKRNTDSPFHLKQENYKYELNMDEVLLDTDPKDLTPEQRDRQKKRKEEDAKNGKLSPLEELRRPSLRKLKKQGYNVKFLDLQADRARNPDKIELWYSPQLKKAIANAAVIAQTRFDRGSILS